MSDIPPEFRDLFEPSPAPQQTPKRLRKCQREAKFILENRGSFRPPEQTLSAAETDLQSDGLGTKPQ